MVKKIVLLLTIAAFVAGGVFAQAENAENAENLETEPETAVYETAPEEDTADSSPDLNTPAVKRPMNTIIVDIGPTIIGLGTGMAGNILFGNEVEGGKVTGFGIGAHYERQIFDTFSVGLRFAYLGIGMGMTFKEEKTDESFTATAKTSTDVNLYSFSLEGHARYYPWGKTFFLDGMMGYANMSMKISGRLDVSAIESNSGHSESENISISETFSRHFFKMGAKLGWRIDFGKPGGFTFEPALGYSIGLGGGDTFFQQLENYAQKKLGSEAEFDKDTKDVFDLAFALVEQLIFVGGPRFTLAFGWRF